MKKRITRIANFFAFNLLFFALYLNFIHKDQNNIVTPVKPSAATVKGTVLVENPERYLNRSAAKDAPVHVNAVQSQPANDNTTALKLSIN